MVRILLLALMILPAVTNLPAQRQGHDSTGYLLLSEFLMSGDTTLLTQALVWSEDMQDDRLRGEIYRRWGKYYDEADRAEKSLFYYQKALDIFQKVRDTIGMIKTHVNAGFMFFGFYEIDRALQHTEAALRLSRQTEDDFALSIILGNLGAIYEHMPGRLADALACHQEVLQLAVAEGDTMGMLVTYNNLGVLYERIRQYDEAGRNYQEALRLAITLSDSLEICRIFGNLASVNISVKAGREALRYLLTSEAYCHIAPLSLQAHRKKLLSNAYKLMGRYQEALVELDTFTMLSDSLFAEDRANTIQELVVQYETEKKEQQITLLEVEQQLQQKTIRQQKLTQGILGGGIAFLGIFSTVFFFQRNRIAKEKQRSESLLLNILPVEVADELKQTGRARARKFENTTILFSDFVHFTDHAAALSPEDLVAELDTCFRAFDAIIEKHGLEKIKTIGDAYLAISGLPHSQKDHAHRVCRAALEIRDFIVRRKSEGGFFEIRLGIHSGPVIAGIVGLRKYAYDIWGDTVNVAARMEQNSLPGKINLSEVTYQLVEDAFHCSSRGRIPIKNKGEVTMYFLNNSIVH